VILTREKGKKGKYGEEEENEMREIILKLESSYGSPPPLSSSLYLKPYWCMYVCMYVCVSVGMNMSPGFP